MGPGPRSGPGPFFLPEQVRASPSLSLNFRATWASLPPNGKSMSKLAVGTTLAVDTSDFKNGMHISLDGDVYTIVEFQHVKPGKGGAFVRTRLRKLKSGATLERTFRSGEKVEPVFVEKRKLQYLYR